MFAHLHLHTEYSLLDGACRIGPLLDRIKELGQTACAVTDHGAMYGVVEFYRACLARGIHPVIGCEVYVAADMHDKSGSGRDYSHLILLCENDEGYHNLIRLVSEGFVHGFYYKPRVDYALLKKYHKGLIALSACLSGDINRLLLEGRRAEARKMALRYLDIYGEGNYFIELQNHGLPEEKRILPDLIQLARALQIPMVATNDCHYINRDDARAQEILMCIQTGKTLSDEKRMRMHTDQLYVKSEEEMRELFPDLEEALENTGKIAERCQVTFDFSTRHLPSFPLEEGQNARELLRELCRQGLKRRYPSEDDAARERLAYELRVIEGMGFVDYFLIVWDFVRYAREHGILVGPGRGSAAGSVVAYCLGITSIDPMKYNLLFERFLNPERISMPDIDIDFDYERRQEVIEYVARRYGADHVSQIITFGTMAAKQAIRDVGRVMDMSYQEVDAISKMVPFALDMTLNKALEINPELRKAYEETPRIRELIDTARKLEGMPRHASTHAAGVLITGEPVANLVPLQTNDTVITTQFPMGTLESLGLLKMDFLGLRTLTVIGDSLKLIRQGHGIEMTPEEIPLDDAAVYEMISQGETDGVFQLEGGGMRSFLANMRPKNFEDIIAAISLYRPGPMESIPRYLEGRQHPERVHYEDEKLRPILGVTYGCMVYQEQVMQIVRDLAGYSLGRSDLVRRAMAKKKHDVMLQEKAYFVHGKLGADGEVEVPGALRMGVSEAAAEKLFDEMTAFASYAFNKSHAAVYGVVAIQTAWLKRHYPVEFMAAMMNSVTGNSDKVAFYIQYCRKHGIGILPPDVNVSAERFSVEGQAIRFGLNAVKNAGRGAIQDLLAARGNSPFRDLFDFCERISGTSINKKMVESMIRSGALDSLPGNRAQKINAFERAMDAAAGARRHVAAGQISLFGEDFGDLMQNSADALADLAEFPKRQLLAMEKEVTGVYITGHPLEEYETQLAALPCNHQTLEAYAEESDHGARHDGTRVTMGGLIADVRTRATKSGGLMGIVQLEDLYGTTEALVFPRVWERIGHELTPDRVVALIGNLSVRQDETPKLRVEQVAALSDLQTLLRRPGGAVQMREPATPYEADALPARIRELPAFMRPDDAPAGGKLFLRLRDEEQREDVFRILMRTPGSIPVVLAIGPEKRRENLLRHHWVADDYDQEALRALLTPAGVVYRERAAKAPG